MAVGEGFDLPTGTEPWSDFHWFQASSRGDLDIVILSLAPAWYTGHFIGNRMVPCAGSGCEICALGVGGQIRYVFSVAEHSTHRVGLMEFGRGNGQLIRDWSDRYGGLRGLRLVVRKHTKNSQSRTEMQYIEDPPGQWFLSLKAPDPQLALYLTWNKMQCVMPEGFKSRMVEVVSEMAAKKEGMSEKDMWLEKMRLAKKVKSRG